MLKFLLDEHVSPRVADGLQRRKPPIAAHAMVDWKDAALLGLDDSSCLREAAAHGMTLVTYDRRTIPFLLKSWAEEGRSHAGVIFVDEKTISPANIGGLVRSLIRLHRETSKWDWTDRIIFLRR
jgi:predicted nuclease of predicted toxin-antitoxin system